MKKILLLFFFSGILYSAFAQAPVWLWAKGMGGTYIDYGNDVAVDLLGNVYTVGGFWGTVDFDPGPGIFNLTSAGNFDIFISKLDSAGNFVWAKQIGNTLFDDGFSIAVDPSGSGDIYTTGAFQGSVDFDPGPGTFNLTSAGGTQDIFVSRLDASGNFVWAKAMGGTDSNDERGQSISVDASGNVYTTGYFWSVADFDPGPGIFNLTAAGARDIFVSKLNSSGNFLWAKQIGGIAYDVGYSVALHLSGSQDVYTTGSFRDTVDFDPGPGVFNLTAVGAEDIFISRLDSAGNFVWAKQIGGISSDVGLSTAIDDSGNVITTGTFQGTVDFNPDTGIFNLISGGNLDIFISKLNASGNFVWAKQIGGAALDAAYSIALYPSGNENIYTTGSFRNTVDFDPGPGVFNLTATSASFSDIFILRLDGSGNFVWVKAAGGANDDIGRSLAFDASGYLHVAGYFASPSISFGSSTLINDTTDNTYDVFIARLDTSAAIPTGINDAINASIGVFVYPNPAGNELRIQSAELKIESVEIYDVIGDKMFSRHPAVGSQQLSIDVSEFTPGIYFVKVKGEGKEHITKFVKQ